MYPEFAYSVDMQLILAVISFTTAYIFVYCIAKIILQIHGEEATVKQKGTFAFLIGVILDSAWVYMIYLIGGAQCFSEALYTLVVTTNPIFALLYYFIGIKVLNLSPVRSIKLMGYVYIYFATVKILSHLLESAFFVQLPGRYNFMLDAFNRITFVVIFLFIFMATQYILKKHRHVIKLKDNLFINLKKEVALYFGKAAVIYLLAVGIPFLISEKIAANLVLLIIFTLGLSLTIMGDLYMATKNEVENNITYIGVLSKEISAIYMGEAIALQGKINENPSLISILMSKCEYAEKMNVKIRIELNSSVRDLFINNIDACKIVDCLLDNAIESAVGSEQKLVSFTVESKSEKGKLLIVNNSIAVLPDSEEVKFGGKIIKRRNNKRFDVVWKTIENYGNCIFHLAYYKDEMTAYLETKQSNMNRPQAGIA